MKQEVSVGAAPSGLTARLRQALGRGSARLAPQAAVAAPAEERRQHHRLIQQFSAVVAAAPVGIGLTRERRFERVNALFCELTGWTSGEILGRSPYEVFSSINADDSLGEAVRAAFAAGQRYRGELDFRRRDGTAFRCRLQGQLVDASDPTAGTLWLLDAITHTAPDATRTSALATRDPLTQLLDRAAFESHLAYWLAQPQPGLPAALFVIDLDGFAQINTIAGRGAGDALLREVAALLESRVRRDDAVSRLEADCFAMLLPGCVAAVALQLARRLREEIAGLAVHSLRPGATATIGLTEVDPAAALSAQDWMARAQAAWYEAKYGGRGAVRQAERPGRVALVTPA